MFYRMGRLTIYTKKLQRFKGHFIISHIKDLTDLLFTSKLINARKKKLKSRKIKSYCIYLDINIEP